MSDWLDGYFENKGILESTLNIPMQRTVSAVRVALVEPAVTFTSAIPSSAADGADTLLTSAGVHGLTSAVSVGNSIYISAGTGWTVGFHTITSIAVDTTGTTIQIDTPFDVGFGTPTIALAGTEVTVATIVIPPLFNNSYIDIDWSYNWTSTGNNKNFRVKYGNTAFSTVSATTNASGRTSVLISNRDDTNSQLGGLSVNNATGFGVASLLTATGAVNSSISQNLTLTLQPVVANEIAATNRHIILVWR